MVTEGDKITIYTFRSGICFIFFLENLGKTIQLLLRKGACKNCFISCHSTKVNHICKINAANLGNNCENFYLKICNVIWGYY